MKIQIVISIIISILFYLYFHLQKQKSQKNNNNHSNIINSLFIGLISWFILDKSIYMFNQNKLNVEISNGTIYDTENSIDNEQMYNNLADF